MIGLILKLLRFILTAICYVIVLNVYKKTLTTNSTLRRMIGVCYF